jgi:hypothetical protein
MVEKAAHCLWRVFRLWGNESPGQMRIDDDERPEPVRPLTGQMGTELNWRLAPLPAFLHLLFQTCMSLATLAASNRPHHHPAVKPGSARTGVQGKFRECAASHIGTPGTYSGLYFETRAQLQPVLEILK